MTIFNNHTLQFLEKGLEGSVTRHKSIAHNIANVNTPGYKSVQVNFQDQLKSSLGDGKTLALKTTTESHVTNRPQVDKITPQVLKLKDTSITPDGNNVDVDREMAEMAKNIIYQNTAVSQVNKRLSILKYVISEGRG